MPAPPNPAFQWKPLVVCPHAEIAKRLTATLREALPTPPELLTEYPRMGSLASVASQKGANICFLDVATNSEHAQVLISELSPTVPVVALLVRNDADLILRCLRRGACEFLAEPGMEALRAVFDRLGRVHPAASHQSSGTVWCVVPGKPGCGASTLAVHLAIQSRTAGGPVLLVDTDPLAASAAFLLKLKPEFHLGDMLRDWKRMDDDLWARFTLPACGVDVLAAPEDAATRLDLNRQIASELCTFWRQRYQTVVLDLPDVRTAVDTGFAALADTILLVTTNELAALQTTHRALVCLDPATTDRARVRLILNRYTPATGLKREDVQKALSLEPLAALCNDYETIQSALLEGRPAPPGSRFASSVESLCRQLQDKAAPTRKNSSWLGSILARR
jgi:pilus assembly protein CpaE